MAENLTPPPRLGITVMPEWFQSEGVDAVLDRLQAIGATALATSPYLLEIAPAGEGAREPPPDGDAGSVRPLDRLLWGVRETWVRTAPSLVHDPSRYRGLRYQPGAPSALTRAQARLIDDVVEAADRRSIAVYLQVMAASPPGYKVQFSSVVSDDQCLGPDGLPHPQRVDANASLASPHVRDYGGALLAELAQRYPGVHGFRIDWPEYPPYDLRSALFDFNPHAHAALRAKGVVPDDYGRQVCTLLAAWRSRARAAAGSGVAAVRAQLAQAGWDDFFGATGAGAPLWASKRASVAALLRHYRQALDQVPGQRRVLEPQVFPAPLSHFSGVDWDALAQTSDAVGVKLYTMHWPMMARFWAHDLVGEQDKAALDVVTAAMMDFLGFADQPPTDGASLLYPSPELAHPVGVQAQRDKIAQAQRAATTVPVIAFAHSYGPRGDVALRARTALQASATGTGAGAYLWVNRYGYLSDAKLSDLAQLMQSQELCT
jgi:hypothetical protein